MKLKKIKLNNIRSYENQEIEFPSGSTLLSGDIGSGKTSILLGIEFALFGLQPGQRGASLLRNQKDSGGVEINFEVDDKDIIIERTLKKGKSISQDSCTISVNGDKKQISVMELKNFVLELLNYPKEFSKKQNTLYKFTVYTPQEEMKQIILQDSETRINTLRHIFGIDKYKKIIENTSLLISKIREERRIKEGIISSLEEDKMSLVLKENDLEEKNYALSSLEKEFFSKTEERKKIQEEKEKISVKIEGKLKIQQEIEKRKIIISNKNENILLNEKTVEQLENQINESRDLKFEEEEIPKLQKEISMKKGEKNSLNEKIMELSSQLISLETKTQEIKSIKDRINHIRECPTCLQEVSDLYKGNMLKKINSEISENTEKISLLNVEKNSLLVKSKIIDSEALDFEKKVQDLNDKKFKLQNRADKEKQKEEIEKRNQILNEEINVLTLEIEKLENSLIDFKKFDEVFEELKEKFDEALKQERIIEVKVAEIRREIQVFSKQTDELRERINKTEKIKEQFFYLIQLEEWLSGKFISLVSFIEKNIMVKLKLEFSKLFAEWFSMLVSEIFYVKINDEFSPVIEQKDYEIDYQYLSGGEKTAIALAYRLALNQVINSLLSNIKTKDVVILDEPTDGFSSQQLDKMRDVLNELNIGQLIIVSHEQKIESFVDNVIKFRKENGISVIEK